MALPTLDATFASAADLPRKYMLARWLVGELGSGSIADYVTLPERYLWAKIAVAAGATLPEANYISLPIQYVWKAIYDAVSGSSLGTIDWVEKQALGHIAAAYRGDTANPENLATYIDWPWRYQVASIIDAFTAVQFSPSDLSGLFEWFSADEGALTSLSPDVLANIGDGVTRFTNKVSGGQNANQTDALRQPIYGEDSRGKYLEFTNLSDVLNIDRKDSDDINPPLTYYGVCAFTESAASFLINRGLNPNNRNALYQRQSGEVLALRASTEVASTLSVDVQDNVGNVFVVCGVLNGDGTGLVGRGSVSNQTNIAYAEESLSGLGTGTTTQSVYRLGASNSAGGGSLSFLYEFIAYNQAHSEADRLKVVNYLQDKYGA